MGRTKWTLLVLTVLVAVYYFVFFFKTYSEENVMADADHIVVLDVKRVARTLLWNYITTPGQWKLGSLLKSSEEVEWKDMIRIPDYVFVFHVKNQPANAWYSVFETGDPDAFQKGLQRYEFRKSSDGPGYYSIKHQLQFIQSGSKVLVSSFSVSNELLRETAFRLFEQKQYAGREQLQQAISVSGHMGWYYWGNEWITKGQGALHFDKNHIRWQSSLTLQEPVAISNYPFQYADSALISIGFVQPPTALFQKLGDKSRAEVSKAIGFNMDSVLLPQNQLYQVEIPGTQLRVDSAISYTYDEQFNQVANAVVTRVDEPELNLNIRGSGVGAITNYLLRNNILDATEQGWWFTALPFAKTFYDQVNDSTAQIKSLSYTAPAYNTTINALLFAEFNIARMPAAVLGYLPADMVKAMSNLQFVRLTGTAVNDSMISVNVLIQKKNNDMPLVP